MNQAVQFASAADKGYNETGFQAATVADLAAEQLARWGVRFVFGVPGEDNLAFLDAVHRHPRLQFYATRTEGGASLMASAVAKLTGEIAVCTATSGPGVANLINGLADAYTDGAPVVAVTGQVERVRLGTDSKQYVDQQALLSAVTGRSFLVTHPDSISVLLAEAMRTALHRRCATHISVPRDVWQQPTSAPLINPEPYLQTPPQSPPYVIDEAARLLSGAERPALVVGLGAAPVIQEVLYLAEKLTAPIIHTLPIAGKIPWQHPLVVGGLGEGGAEVSSRLLEEADWVFRIGANWWPAEFTPARGPRIMALDVRPDQLGRGAGTAYGLVGDSRHVIPHLNGAILPKARPEWERRIHELRAQWIERLGAEAAQDGAGPNGAGGSYNGQMGGIHPARIIAELNKVIPPDAIICLDVGDHVLWFNRHFQGSGQDLLLSGSWRTMGFALPAALAAKLVYPYRTVVALTGDGGLTMSIQELGTALQYRIPVTTLLMQNGVLGTEAHLARLEGLHPTGTRLENPDFSRLITAWGGEGYPVRRPEHIRTQVRRALEGGRLALVDIPTRAIPLPTAARRVLPAAPQPVAAFNPI